MKKQLTLMAVIFAVCAMCTESVQAQSKQPFTVHIPFQFVIENETYKPGEYRIERLNAQNPRILTVQPIGQKGRKILFTQRIEAETELVSSELKFTKYDDEYFLSEIWMDGNRNGLRLQKSKREQRMEQNAKNRQTRVLVASDGR